MAELTRARIDVAPLLAAAAKPECGAVNLFLGTTRDHHQGRRVLRLEYEAYERMALERAHHARAHGVRTLRARALRRRAPAGRGAGR